VGVDSKGKRRYATTTVHGTKKEADRALAAFVTETERDRNATAAAEPQSVSHVLNQWLESKESRLSPVTASRYRVAFKHIEPVLGSMPVTRLRPHHIEDLYAALHAKGQSGASIRKAHWALRQSLAWAHRHGYTALVATDGVELPPLGERKIDPPTSDNVRRVFEHLLRSKPDWGTLVAVLAWTGCRPGEACGLHWEDMDLHGGSILIRRAIITVSGGPIERGTKTGELRKIAIGPRTVELLQEHWYRCRNIPPMRCTPFTSILLSRRADSAVGTLPFRAAIVGEPRPGHGRRSSGNFSRYPGPRRSSRAGADASDEDRAKDGRGLAVHSIRAKRDQMLSGFGPAKGRQPLGDLAADQVGMVLLDEMTTGPEWHGLAGW
jgi:integrase